MPTTDSRSLALFFFCTDSRVCRPAAGNGASGSLLLIIMVPWHLALHRLPPISQSEKKDSKAVFHSLILPVLGILIAQIQTYTCAQIWSQICLLHCRTRQLFAGNISSRSNFDPVR